MSTFEPAPPDQPKAQLVVTGPPGMEIQILDAKYASLARGAETLSATLPEGLYFVRWSAFDAVKEEVVFLRGIKRPLKLSYEHEGPEKALEGLASVRPAHDAHDPTVSAIVVLERSDDPRLSGPPPEGLRLFDADETAIGSDSAAVEAQRHEDGHESTTGAGWALGIYIVRPGAYRLRYFSVGGFAVDQMVPAMARRRTVVILRQAAGHALIGDRSSGLHQLAIRGVEPGRTIILSVPRTERGAPSLTQQRLAESLLDAIASHGDPLVKPTLGRIEKSGADPLLRIYAAVLILLALQRAASPASDDPWPEDSEEVASFVARWSERARRLLRDLPAGARALADVAICESRLGDAPRETPIAPPMLAACWRWMDGGATGSSPTIRAAAAGTDVAEPWLTWRATSVKSGEVEIGTGGSPEAMDLVSTSVAGLQRFLSGDPPALKLPVSNFDDPHKYRFGGKASADGFTAVASFVETPDPHWVEVSLVVTAEDTARVRNGEQAVFFLHNSFRPDRVTRTFRGGRAELKLRAFGGFTVGIWLPKWRLQLELDLAEVPGAPRVIREW